MEISGEARSAFGAGWTLSLAATGKVVHKETFGHSLALLRQFNHLQLRQRSIEKGSEALAQAEWTKFFGFANGRCDDGPLSLHLQ
jgi:hypothetical protein